MSNIDLEDRDGIAFITLNRPERLNAMNEEMWAELGRVWDAFAADEGLRVAVVSGAGDRAFSTGMDLKERAVAGDPRAREFWTSALARDPGRREPVWKPMIAAVHGYCLASGHRDRPVLRHPHLQRGRHLRPAGDKAGVLPGQFGHRAAAAHHAVGHGPGDALHRRFHFRGGSLPVRPGEPGGAAGRADGRGREARPDHRRRAPLALQAVKEVVLRGLDLPLADAIRFEAGFRAMVGGTEDAAEGPRAFSEKRKPRYKGR